MGCPVERILLKAVTWRINWHHGVPSAETQRNSLSSIVLLNEVDWFPLIRMSYCILGENSRGVNTSTPAGVEERRES